MDNIIQEENLEVNLEIITEALQILEDYLLFGEKEDNKILDLFCEYSFIDILKIFSFGSKAQIISEQIIKLLSKLIRNMSKETFFYYLLSNNFINNIISKNFLFAKRDKNFLFIYIDFFEALSLKLNLNTLQFLFQEEKGCFPLLDETIKLYNYPDNNIKKIVKNIIVNIIKIEYEPLQNYLASLPAISYFCFLACQLKDEVFILSNEINNKNNSNDNNKKEKIKILLNDIINNLIHIQNIFDINCSKINYILINCLFYYCIIPYILYNLNYDKDEIKNCEKRLKKSICIFFLNLLFEYIKNEVFINILFTLIFFSKTSNTINYYMKNRPIQPINYFYNWNQSIKNNSNSFCNFIQFNFNSSFIKNLINLEKSKYFEVQQIYNKYQELINNEPDFYSEKNKENILKEITKDILNKLTYSEISIMTSYHSYLSVSTGINCGLSDKNKELCIIKKMDNFYQNYFNHDKEIKNNFITNNIKHNLLDIITKKKSSKKILLINILLRNIFQNKNISKILLKEVNLISGSLLNDDEINHLINLHKNRENISDLQTNKENYNPNIKNLNNFEITNKNSIIMTTLISINGFVINSGSKSSEQSQTNIDKNNNYLKEDRITKTKISNENIELKEFSGEQKNKFSLMNYEYFINLEKNFSPSNELYNNEKLLENLISLLDINNNTGLLSVKLIIDNILLLITNKNKSLISHNNKNKLYLIYEKYKNEIILYYNKKKSFHNNAYQLFTRQYDHYVLLENLDIKKYNINNENIIISDSFEKSFLSDINIEINNKFDKIIIYFLLIHDLYYKLISFDDCYTFGKIKDQSGNLFINNFPLIKGDIPLKNYKKYYLLNLDLNILYYDCKCKIIINKINDNKNFFDAYLFILDNFIFIGDSSDDGTYTTIIYKFFISSCSIQKDNYNNKNINMHINNDIDDNKDIEILFDFKDYNTSKYIYSIIQQEIKKAKIFEKDIIKKFIKNLN